MIKLHSPLKNIFSSLLNSVVSSKYPIVKQIYWVSHFVPVAVLSNWGYLRSSKTALLLFNTKFKGSIKDSFVNHCDVNSLFYQANN